MVSMGIPGRQYYELISHYRTHYPDTQKTGPCPILVMPSAKLGSTMYKFGKSLIWCDRESNFRLIRPPRPVLVLVTCRIIPEWLPTGDSVHSWRLYSADPLRARHSTHSHAYHGTEHTNDCCSPSLMKLHSPLTVFWLSYILWGKYDRLIGINICTFSLK